MPGKIKALWYLCIVIIVVGFIMLAAKGKMDEAREHSEVASKVATDKQKEIDKKTVKIDPVKLVRELNALGKYQEAVEIARKAGERNPDHAQIQTWWGISLVKSNKRAEAIKHFILAAKKDPTDEKAHLYWGLTLAMDKKFEDAYRDAGVELVYMSESDHAAWIEIAKKSSHKAFAEQVPGGAKLMEMALAVK